MSADPSEGRERARQEDFGPNGDATTPGFFKPSTPAAPEYSDPDCITELSSETLRKEEA